MKLHTKV